MNTAVDSTLVYALDHPHDLSIEDQLAALGGKAANLGVMSRELGLPVPPGFVITTDACRGYLSDGWPASLDAQLQQAMSALERTLGRGFGDPGDPLLVSVRSGAAVSMPGMMDTILDLGLNEQTTDGLAAVTGDAAFAADCLGRFRTMFRDVVGADAPKDPWQQLRLAIEAVFRSWSGERARAFRAREGIPDSLGTAVTVQAMVFGNRGPDSATGVVFTRNPATGEAGLYGDLLFGAQGEDVVGGTHATEPISALDARLPEAAAALRDAAKRLEHHYRDLCDIEFTIEDGRLWLLQVRVGKRSPGAALRLAVEMADDERFPLTRAEAVERVTALLVDPPRVASGVPDGAVPIASGLGASPGLASGEIALSPERAIELADAGRAAILVRAETSPDDVHGMARAAGVLTARGGLASHAAVVARGWGIPAVVGATALEIGPGGMRIAGRSVGPSDTITIDGERGLVYLGAIAGSSTVNPDALTLLEWARELGIEVPVHPDAQPPAAAGGPADVALEVDDDELLGAIAVKGMALAAGLSDALGAPVERLQPKLDALMASGDLTMAAGAYRLSDVGRERRQRALTADRERVGADRAQAALDSFIDLDGRVKETVTAWQVRTVDGQQQPNDHADATYDREVIERLAAIHDDARAWLSGIESGWPRAGRYERRLSNALEHVLDGEGRYVASPRVDSYHGAWFELHEELISLAGRTRADEVAAGRA